MSGIGDSSSFAPKVDQNAQAAALGLSENIEQAEAEIVAMSDSAQDQSEEAVNPFVPTKKSSLEDRTEVKQKKTEGPKEAIQAVGGADNEGEEKLKDDTQERPPQDDQKIAKKSPVAIDAITNEALQKLHEEIKSKGRLPEKDLIATVKQYFPGSVHLQNEALRYLTNTTTDATEKTRIDSIQKQFETGNTEQITVDKAAVRQLLESISLDTTDTNIRALCNDLKGNIGMDEIFKKLNQHEKTHPGITKSLLHHLGDHIKKNLEHADLGSTRSLIQLIQAAYSPRNIIKSRLGTFKTLISKVNKQLNPGASEISEAIVEVLKFAMDHNTTVSRLLDKTNQVATLIESTKAPTTSSATNSSEIKKQAVNPIRQPLRPTAVTVSKPIR